MRVLGCCEHAGRRSMSLEENKALCNRGTEAINRGDFDAIDEIYAPGNAQKLKEMLAEIRRAFPDCYGMNVLQIAEGDLVLNRTILHGTHLGELQGLTPTGKRVTVEAVSIDRVVDGKIVESWSHVDLGELFQQQLKQAVAERERVEQELRVARRIQQASLPKEVPTLEGWEISPLYQPAREVGGDFYDFHPISEGHVGLVVGDATGKGVPAALVMSTTCGILQLAAQALDSTSPGEVLERVNETLLTRIPANMFVTCFYCILD